jgi:hypothetical protein
MNKSLHYLSALTFACISLFMITGCVSEDGSSIPPQEEESQQGVFRTIFNAMNSEVAGPTVGTATINVSEDVVTVDVNMTSVGSNMVHGQYIMGFGKCPTIEDDANGDGIIDIVESIATTDKALIPLDGDINSQVGGLTDFPTADATFTYDYKQIGSLAAMETDLRLPMPSPSDFIEKLEEDEQLVLTGRHVLILGVPSSVELPETVATVQGFNRNVTLPVACGEIVR